MLGRGDVLTFLADPLTLVLLLGSAIVLLSAVLPGLGRRRVRMLVADD